MTGEGDPFWLGQALAEAGEITAEQLAGAKQLWRRAPEGGFAELLERLELAPGRRLAALIARRHRLPEADLGAWERAAVRLLPPDASRRGCLLPFRQIGRRLDLAVADPAVYGMDEAARDFPGWEVRLHVASRRDILGLIDEAWRAPASARPAANELFEQLLREAAEEGATDLHLEPREHGVEVRQRIDGRLAHKRFVELALREPLLQAAKLAGRMDIAERRLPQDGRGTIFAGARRYHLRYSSMPTVHGESVAVRLIDEAAALRPLDEMGLLPAEAERLRGLLRLPHGLVYVTGPTGSGKTTLLHSLIGSLPPAELSELKILALEEPVEVRHPRFFLQVDVDDRIGRTFAELLRHVLRHDPDVVLVGETRDLKTAEITLKAALTGHLCFSTLHTNDALSAIARLADIGIDPLMLASALKAVVAQRLVRRPCPRCLRPHPENDRLLVRFRPLWRGGEFAGGEPPGFVAAGSDRSCPLCRGRGHRGRIAIAEVFPLQGLERLVAGRAPPEAFLARLRPGGCRTLFEDGVRKAALGLTTIEEVYAAVEEPPL